MSLNKVLNKPVKVLGTLSLYYVGDIAVIVMDGGENRLNLSFIDRFNELMDDVERNATCKGLITTGVGKFYSNGLDLEWLSGPRSPEQLHKFGVKLHEWLMRLLLFQIPTLAAMNGHAFAGGALVAYAHDLRVQNQDRGWLCLNEVWISRQFAKFHYLFLREKMSNGHVYSDAIVLGKRYPAKEAFESKLIHSAQPESLVLTQSINLLKAFYGKSGYPRESLHLMKRDVFREALLQQEREVAEMKGMESDTDIIPKAKL